MEELIFDQLLYDNYCELLTKKQREVLSLRYEEDLSFTEIAEALKISRQAVFDIVKRALKTLNNFEDSLKLVEKDLMTQKKVNEIKKNLYSILNSNSLSENYKELIKKDILLLDEIAN